MSQLGSLLLILVSTHLSAQTVRFLEKTDIVADPEAMGKSLDVLQSSLIEEELTYIGLLEITQDKLSSMFDNLQESSTEAGANIYKVQSFALDTLGQLFYCAIELFRASDSLADFNRSLKTQNTLYIFATFDRDEPIKVDGAKHHLKRGTYLELALRLDRATKVNHGGVTGMSFVAKANQEGTNIYLTTGTGAAGPTIGTGGIGVGFSTGNLQKIREPLAAFMLQVYQK